MKYLSSFVSVIGLLSLTPLAVGQDRQWTGIVEGGFFSGVGGGSKAQNHWLNGRAWAGFTPANTTEVAVLGRAIPATSSGIFFDPTNTINFGAFTHVNSTTPDEVFHAVNATVNALTVTSPGASNTILTPAAYGPFIFEFKSGDETGSLIASNGITITNNSLTVHGGTLTSGNQVQVGSTAGNVSGNLTVEGAGAKVSATERVLIGAGGAGSLLVSGAGASLVTKTRVDFGENGTGTAVISKGATVEANLRVSNGSLTLTGGGTTWTKGVSAFDDPVVGLGRSNQGSLLISSGANFNTNGNNAFVGREGAIGVAVITGAGSAWTHTLGDMIVGGGGLGVRAAPTSGSLTVTQGGTLSFSGQLIIGTLGREDTAAGTVNINNAGHAESPTTGSVQVGSDGGNGALNIASSGTLTTGVVTVGDGKSTGVLTVNGGTLNATSVGVLGGGKVEVYSGSTFETSGTYLMLGGETILHDATISARRFLINGGTLSGNGRLVGNVSVNGGTLAPGFSPGKLDIVGTLSFGGFSVVKMQIGGILAGDYDFIHSSGLMQLGGNLDLEFLNGFVPRSFNFLTLFSSDTGITGNFNNISNGRYYLADGSGSFAVGLSAGSFSIGGYQALVAVPESGTLGVSGAALLGLLVIVAAYRRRSTSKEGLGTFTL